MIYQVASLSSEIKKGEEMAGIGANLGAGLSQGYSQSGQSSGSVNSAESYNNSFNMSEQEAWSHASSGTDAMTARLFSALAAEDAWQKSMGAFHEQMDFNREEAEKQRAWQAEMANTLYTRSVKNMKEAGINPILAANMGLSGASVGSGATASLGGSPSAPLAQNFMDSWSASDSYSHGSSFGEGSGSSWGNGSSWGSGWSNSEEGIITALEGLGGMANAALLGINSGNALENINNALGGSSVTKWGEKIGENIRNSVVGGVKQIGQAISDKISDLGNKGKNGFNGGGGGHGFKIKK